jgi:hypothetical protein
MYIDLLGDRDATCWEISVTRAKGLASPSASVPYEVPS